MDKKDTRPISGLCECADPGCSCGGQCIQEGIIVLYRVDMEDLTGVRFCCKCADDALDSGVFTDRMMDDFDQFILDEFDTEEDVDEAILSDF